MTAPIRITPSAAPDAPTHTTYTANPTGMSPLGVLLNMFSNGAVQHPDQTKPYWSGVAQSFDPRSLSGAANLAGIIVPGMKGMRGEPTPGQQQFLNSIYNSSRGQGASFRRVNGDGVPELFTQTGTPEFPPAQGNKFTAHNPLQILIAKHGASGIGALGDSYSPRRGVDLGNDTTDMTNQQMLDYLFHDYKGNN